MFMRRWDLVRLQNLTAMAEQRIFGFNFLTLVLFLFSLISVNSSDKIAYNTLTLGLTEDTPNSESRIPFLDNTDGSKTGNERQIVRNRRQLSGLAILNPAEQQQHLNAVSKLSDDVDHLISRLKNTTNELALCKSQMELKSKRSKSMKGKKIKNKKKKTKTTDKETLTETGLTKDRPNSEFRIPFPNNTDGSKTGNERLIVRNRRQLSGLAILNPAEQQQILNAMSKLSDNVDHLISRLKNTTNELALCKSQMGSKAMEGKEIKNGGGKHNSGKPKSISKNGITNFRLAQAVLRETNSLPVLGKQLRHAKTAGAVFSVAGLGSLVLEGATGDSIISGIGAGFLKLKRVAAVTPQALLILSITHIPEVGVGSDKVPGRTPEYFMSLSVPARVMDLPDKDTLRLAARETGVVNLPIRGELVTEKDVDLRIVRTPDVTPVKVVEAVLDEKTGLYITALPNTTVPGGKLVTTPPSVPTVQGQRPLVNPIAPPPLIVHTGNIDGFKSPLVEPFPASEAHEGRDIVLVYPDNAGMDPVYVMYNKPRKGVAHSHEDYIPAPKTEEITGFPGLIPQPSKNPRQGGGGYRARWKDAKGRKLFEWDYRHGDLELYRASDGKHLGSFDHKTGLRKPGKAGKAKPERSIPKKYL